MKKPARPTWQHRYTRFTIAIVAVMAAIAALSTVAGGGEAFAKLAPFAGGFALAVVCAWVAVRAGGFLLYVAAFLGAVVAVLVVTVTIEGGLQAGAVEFFCAGCVLGLVGASLARYLYPRQT